MNAPWPDMNADLLKKISCLAFAGYLAKGYGAVIMREPESSSAEQATKELLYYAPCQEEKNDIPPDALPLVQDYDPQKEMILSVIDKKEETLSLKLTVNHLKTTPIEAFRNWSKKNGRGRFAPGEVLHLRTPINDIRPGYYIFLRREEVMMVLSIAGMDDDEGDMCRTNQIVKVHSDYEDEFDSQSGIVEIV